MSPKQWTALGGGGTFAAAITALGSPVAKLWVAGGLIIWGGYLIADAVPKIWKPESPAAEPDTGDVRPPGPQANPTVPNTLLGPEDADSLRKLGFELREFPTLNRWERKFDPKAGDSQTDENFEEIEVIIAKGGMRQVYASVFDIHNECAWKSKEPRRYEFENGAVCDLSKLLSKPKYQARMRPATDVVYIGVESYPNSPIVTQCHGTLSHCRYLELATMAHRARPDDWELRRHWGLDLGKANKNEPTLEFDQRRAILMGIKERVSTVPLDQAVRDIVMTTHIKDVRLSDYSNSMTAVPEPLAMGNSSGVDPHQ